LLGIINFYLMDSDVNESVFPCFRYLLGRSSNMAIVDVEIPSGYIYTGWRYTNDSVRTISKYQLAIYHKYMYGCMAA
jgi:hypothetical protein